jgi:hypothetical protein
MNTLLLDRTTSDLCLDAAGNLAIASDPYSILQDVALACSVIYGELWYDTAKGVRYQNILGQNPPLAYIKAQYVTAALTVPGVASAVCFISSIANREVQGQIQVTTTSGATGTIQISGPQAIVIGAGA